MERSYNCQTYRCLWDFYIFGPATSGTRNWRTVPNSRETALMKTRVSRRKGTRGECARLGSRVRCIVRIYCLIPSRNTRLGLPRYTNRESGQLECDPLFRLSSAPPLCRICHSVCGDHTRCSARHIQRSDNPFCVNFLGRPGLQRRSSVTGAGPDNLDAVARPQHLPQQRQQLASAPTSSNRSSVA